MQNMGPLIVIDRDELWKHRRPKARSWPRKREKQPEQDGDGKDGGKGNG
jgi:hypothetical protein